MIVSLQHFGILPLLRHKVAALTSGIITVSDAVLIALFGILSGPAALFIGSFCITFFFKETVWLIFSSGG